MEDTKAGLARYVAFFDTLFDTVPYSVSFLVRAYETLGFCRVVGEDARELEKTALLHTLLRLMERGKFPPEGDDASWFEDGDAAWFGARWKAALDEAAGALKAPEP